MAGIQWLSAFLASINGGGGGGGGDATFNDFITGSVHGDYRIATLTDIREYALYKNNKSTEPLRISVDPPTGSLGFRRSSFEECSNLTLVNAPGSFSIDANCFSGTALEYVDFPMITTADTGAFRDCASLKWANMGKIPSFNYGVFQNCTNLRIIALGVAYAVQFVQFSSGGFSNSPFANGANCALLVPRAKISQYQTGWSTWVSNGGQILALEDYTLENPDVENMLDHDKMSALYEELSQ